MVVELRAVGVSLFQLSLQLQLVCVQPLHLAIVDVILQHSDTVRQNHRIVFILDQTDLVYATMW